MTMDPKMKSPPDPKLLAEVARIIELDSIRCLSIEGRVLRIDEPRDGLSLEFSFNTKWRSVGARPGIDVVFELSARLVEHLQSGARSDIFSFAGVWELNYSLPEVPSADWAPRLDLFAATNAVVNVWPYARADLHDRLVRAGLPPLLLPVYRPGRGTEGRAEFRRGDTPAAAAVV